MTNFILILGVRRGHSFIRLALNFLLVSFSSRGLWVYKLILYYIYFNLCIFIADVHLKYLGIKYSHLLKHSNKYYDTQYSTYVHHSVGIKFLFGLLSQHLFGPLLFGRVIVQAVPNEYFCPFYVSIQILYGYHYCSFH